MDDDSPTEDANFASGLDDVLSDVEDRVSGESASGVLWSPEAAGDRAEGEPPPNMDKPAWSDRLGWCDMAEPDAKGIVLLAPDSNDSPTRARA